MRLASHYTDRKALAITLCWVAALGLTGSTDVLLFLAPALLLVVPLFAGRYLGAELIVELAARRARARTRPAAPALRPPHAPATWSPRGTRLIAFGLAKRPPPARPLPQN